MTLEEWAIGKQREMLELWETELKDSFPYGFELTTSPVLDDPRVLIFGRNPGGASGEPPHKHMRRFLDEEPPNYGFSKTHDYAEGGKTYPIARWMRNNLFEGKEEMLAKTIETNRFFLRTKDMPTHSKRLDELRTGGKQDVVDDYEALCRETITGFIEKGEPEVVISFTGDMNGKTPLEQISELGSYDPQLSEQYEITRKSQNKNGTVVTTNYRVSFADLGKTTFIGLSPHLSTPSIPGPVRDLFSTTISEQIPDAEQQTQLSEHD